MKNICYNIMFHALMAGFQLELFIFIAYFCTVLPLTSFVFFPVGLSSLMRRFKQVFLGVTSDVVLTTKDLLE
jgi:hypothetical protein